VLLIVGGHLLTDDGLTLGGGAQDDVGVEGLGKPDGHVLASILGIVAVEQSQLLQLLAGLAVVLLAEI